MTILPKLIEELCPNGVEYKTLGEIAIDIFRGAGIKREEVTAEGIPCVRYGEIYTTYGVWFDECVSHTVLENVPSPKYFEHGDILFAITGESVEDIAKSCAYVGYEKCLAGGDIVVLKHTQDPKYLAYALSSTEAQMQKSKGKVKSKVVHSSVPAIKEIVVPVPPIEVQREIVRILDNFTELTAELTAELIAELIARKQQYEYYRDELLTHDIHSSEQEFAEVFDVITDFTAAGSFADLAKNIVYQSSPDYAQLVRTTDLKHSFNNADFVFIGKDAYDYLWRVQLTQESIVLPNIGVNCGEVYYVTPSKLPYRKNALGPNAILVRSTKNNNRFLFYLLHSQSFQMQLRRIISSGGQPKFNKTELKKLKLRLPSRNVQDKTVDVLDNFDAICTDLNIGLPAEIDARQKQYEYYRDKLLTFKEKEA